MFASDSVSLPRLDNPTGACPTHRRQWADFLVSLMAPLHRQYKTARTETRRHLLLKIRQMPTQTSASRGYVLFRGAIRDTRKSAHCLRLVGHTPRVSKRGRLFILELFCLWFSCNITYHPKARYAYCGSSILMGSTLHRYQERVQKRAAAYGNIDNH